MQRAASTSVTTIVGGADAFGVRAPTSWPNEGSVPTEDEVELSIGGLCQQVEPNRREHVRWGRRVLAVGDQVCICIVATDATAAPIRRYRSDRTMQEQPFTAEELLQMERETYLQLKKKFEGVDG